MPMLLWICAESWTNCTMLVPMPSATSTSTALSQCASRSERRQTAVGSFIAERACLDRDFERVID
jgi:hypothetical protein